ncbi:hypothetical protein ACQPZJ_02710 [Actinoplanes sp. CA-054009]
MAEDADIEQAAADLRRDGRHEVTAVRAELEDTGVTVTSLMPGPTGTRFFERAEMTDTAVGAGPKDDPAQVAAQGSRR